MYISMNIWKISLFIFILDKVCMKNSKKSQPINSFLNSFQVVLGAEDLANPNPGQRRKRQNSISSTNI